MCRYAGHRHSFIYQPLALKVDKFVHWKRMNEWCKDKRKVPLKKILFTFFSLHIEQLGYKAALWVCSSPRYFHFIFACRTIYFYRSFHSWIFVSEPLCVNRISLYYFGDAADISICVCAAWFCCRAHVSGDFSKYNDIKTQKCDTNWNQNISICDLQLKNGLSHWLAKHIDIATNKIMKKNAFNAFSTAKWLSFIRTNCNKSHVSMYFLQHE